MGLRTQVVKTGEPLSYKLTNKHCAGTISNEVHNPCLNETAPYCPTHTDIWQCARCIGDCSKPLDTCDETHAIYLAAFAPDIFKVGVTREWRLQTRLTEQGADRAAHIKTVSDGRIARQLEAEIATDLTDQVRTTQKLKNIHKHVDIEAWDTLLEEHDALSTFNFDYEICISQQPIPATILSGTILGTQGRVLLLENNESTYAVDMRDLVGYEFTESLSDLELQASLTSFGKQSG